MQEGTWTISPCPDRQAGSLARELGLSEITASVLVRRGYGDPEQARAFLAGEQPLHDPFLLGDMGVAVERIRAAVAAGQRICVHGDYDVDGICATVLAVLVLRELGADVEWHLPSRFDEGYGVNGGTLERLAEQGCGLVLTVDCGITAVEEVRRARELGLDVIVTDHHRPAEELPDCPVVATRPSTYPFRELCGTGVAYKLGQALLGPDADVLRRHLDLVALATIADVVPLVGENRSLAIAGLRALARTQKPGLQAARDCGRGRAARSRRSTCTPRWVGARSSSSASAGTARPPASRSCRSGSSRSPTRSRLRPKDCSTRTISCRRRSSTRSSRAARS